MAALSFIRPYQHLTHILTWAPKLYSTNCWICLFAVFLAEKLVEFFSWNMKNHMSVNIVLVTRWLQQSRNEEKSYLSNQKKKPKRELGKYTNTFPDVQKARVLLKFNGYYYCISSFILEPFWRRLASILYFIFVIYTECQYLPIAI